MPPVKQPTKPKLVNRGPAGLLKKTPATKPQETSAPSTNGTVNKIAPQLRKAGLVVSIDKLVLDPMNARLHPDRNLEAIKASLSTYGQVKPVVVRKQTSVVVAGNGTLESAKLLGWTEIAATFVEMSEVEAAGYGLADNRSAELARWDFETVARIDKLLLEANHAQIGWSLDELEVLRTADWTPPPVDETSDPTPTKEHDTIKFTADQRDVLDRAIAALRDELFSEGQTEAAELDEAACIINICQRWMGEEHEGLVTEEESGLYAGDIPF